MVKFGGGTNRSSGETGIRYLGEQSVGGNGYSPQLDLAQYIALLATGKKVQADDLYGGLDNAKANSLTYWGRNSFPGEGGAGDEPPTSDAELPVTTRTPTRTRPATRTGGTTPGAGGGGTGGGGTGGGGTPEVPTPPPGSGGGGGTGGEPPRGGEGGNVPEGPRVPRNQDPGVNRVSDPTPEELLRQWVQGQRR